MKVILTTNIKKLGKIGDLVKFESKLDKDGYETELRKEHGLVVQISKTGHDTTSVQVIFGDGELWWVDSGRLEIISENHLEIINLSRP